MGVEMLLTSVLLQSTIIHLLLLGKTSHDSQDLASCTVLHSMDRSALSGLRLCVSVVDGY